MPIFFLFFYIACFICSRELLKPNNPEKYKTIGFLCMLLISAAYDFTIILTGFKFLAAAGAALLVVLINADLKIIDDTGENVKYTLSSNIINLFVSILVLLIA